MNFKKESSGWSELSEFEDFCEKIETKKTKNKNKNKNKTKSKDKNKFQDKYKYSNEKKKHFQVFENPGWIDLDEIEKKENTQELPKIQDDTITVQGFGSSSDSDLRMEKDGVFTIKGIGSVKIKNMHKYRELAHTKQAKIIVLILFLLLLVGVITYVSVDSYINNALDNADIELDQLTINNMGNDELNTTAVLSVDTKTSVVVSFELSEGEVEYNDNVFGKVAFSKKSYTTVSDEYTTNFVVQIADIDSYYLLIDDFLNEEEINLPFEVSVQFQGQLSIIKDKVLKKTLSFKALNGLQFELDNFNLLDFTEEIISVSSIASAEVVSNIEATLPGIDVKLYHGEELVGRILQNELFITNGINELDFQISLDATNDMLITSFIQEEELTIRAIGYLYIEGLQDGDDGEGREFPTLFDQEITLSAFNNFPFEFNKMGIEKIESDNLTMFAQVEFNNTSSIKANFSLFNLELYSNRDNQIITQIDIENLIFSPGVNVIDISTVINEKETLLFQDFAMNSTVDFHFDASIQVKQDGVKIEILNNREISLVGLSGLPFEFKSSPQVYVSEDSIVMEIEIQYNYTSEISANIPRADINIYYEDVLVGNATTRDLSFQDTGIKILNFPVSINGSANSIIETFLNQDNVTFNLIGQVYGDYISESGIQIFEKPFEMEGIGGLNFSLKNVQLNGFNQDEILFEIEILFEHEHEIQAELETLYINLYYGSQYVGEAQLSNLSITTGQNSFTLEASINPNDGDGLIDDFILLNEISILGVGRYQQNDTQNQSKMFEIEIQFEAFGGLPFALNQIEMTNFQKDLISLNISAEINNPTQIEPQFDLIIIEIYYLDTYIGKATKENQLLLSGDNSIDFAVGLIENDTSLIEDFIMQQNLTFSFIAEAQIGSQENSAIQFFEKQHMLNGLNGLPFNITLIKFVEYSNDLLFFDLEINLFNPSESIANFQLICIDIYWQNKTVGNTTLEDIQIQPNENILFFTANLDGNSDGIIDTFIDDPEIVLDLVAYIQFENDDGEGEGSGGGDDDDRLHLFNSTVNVQAMNGINTIIGDFKVLNSTDDSLELSIEVSLENPTEIEMIIESTDFEVFFKNNSVGMGTKQNITFSPGVIDLNLILTMQGDDEIISQFLGDYISGETLDLQVNMSIFLELTENSDPFEINLLIDTETTGIQSELVKVEVQDIAISLVFMSVTYTVTWEVDICNPLDFSIIITSFKGNATFNDSDGSSFLILSYPAEYNIFITYLQFDWQEEEKIITNESCIQQVDVFSDNDLELGIRLNSELDSGALLIDIFDAELGLQIGKYSTTVIVDLLKIPVEES
ncbi:hypothetical protein M0812_06286 [Anaeramoeba flamelloides]|uniref:Uncharacterized protein n=1 Tax=Anaeramoeba flamelloides TaxID=1746091 RepID=A0AAV8A7A4_9EUKA|nr:hypothetical protein M0812_06286 [Anaeramoeba flamelloides]